MFFVASEELPGPIHSTNSPDHPEHELAARYTSYKNPNLPFSTLRSARGVLRALRKAVPRAGRADHPDPAHCTEQLMW